jgi:hypothetical protein
VSRLDVRRTAESTAQSVAPDGLLAQHRDYTNNPQLVQTSGYINYLRSVPRASCFVQADYFLFARHPLAIGGKLQMELHPDIIAGLSGATMRKLIFSTQW